MTNCTFTFTNDDDFGDTLRILSSADAINPGPSETVITSLPIIAVTGTTTCTVGGSLPCDVAVGGTVTFQSNQYIVQPTDPDPLPDQARVTYQDLCDVAPVGSGCTSGSNLLTAGASTDLISGCGPGPTCTPTPTPTTGINTPTNTPTPTDTPTSSPTNTPPELPPVEVPTLSFPMMALLGLVLAGAGLFLARRS